MGSKVMPYGNTPDKVRPKIIEALASAVHEWVLMFLLYIEASFSYLVTKFARNHHLETPCLLCSRLDHVFGKERSNYYLDFFCDKHTSQMSSLVLCHYHSNLVDVHEMCENCLFSFAAVNKSNAETYRLLVGKMGDRPQIGLDGNPKSCSCCHVQSVSRAYAPQMSPPESPAFQGTQSVSRAYAPQMSPPKSPEFQGTQSVSRAYAPQMSPPKSPEFQGSELKFPLPCFVSSEVNEHKVSKDETYRAGKVSPSSMSNFNPIPHVELEKVKLTSDFESETPISNDVAASFLLKEHCKRCLAELGVGTSSDDPVSRTNAIVEHENATSATPDLMSFANYPLTPRVIVDVVGLHKETLEVIEEAEVETEELKETTKSCEVANPSILLSTSEEQSHSEGGVREEAKVATKELKKSAEKYEVANPSVSLSTSEEQSHSEGDVREEAEVETKELKESAGNSEVAYPSISLSTSEEQSHPEGGIKEEAEVETKEFKQSAENFKVAIPSISLSTSEEQSHSEGDVREEAEVETKELKESTDNCEVANLSISLSTNEEQSHSEGDVGEESEVKTKELRESAENSEVPNLSVSPSISEEQSHSEGDIGGRGLQMPDSLELRDAYKLAVNSRRRQLSSKFLERSLSGKLLQQRSLSFKESPRGNEDFHHLLSQLSLARGVDLPLPDMSPNLRRNLGESVVSDASSSAGTRALQRKVSFAGNDSNISPDGSSVNEIEGESEVDRLKRQVDHDKELMYALYKELEEERNASAIAANQAMAMITRLQEEKAAVNMEALQCLRMMDEQVGYDEEGLETAMNLLTERDEVVQDLEFKLELYTQKYGPLSLEELEANDVNACHLETSTISNPESNMEDTLDSQAGGSRDRNQLS